MPRAIVKTAAPIVVTRQVHFRPETEEELIDLLGYDLCSAEHTKGSKEIIAQTAQAAANYRGTVELALDLPGPAHIHAEIKAFRKKGDFSDKAWGALHPWTQQALARYGVFRDNSTDDTKELIDACEQHLESHPVKPSGRPRLQARARLIKALCRIFHAFSSRDGLNDALCSEDEPGLTERRQQGAVSSYSQLEQDRYEFVCTVFTAIGIPLYKDLHEDIVIQANTADEYARRLSIIASRSRRRRRKLKQLR